MIQEIEEKSFLFQNTFRFFSVPQINYFAVQNSLSKLMQHCYSLKKGQ